jgi:hypothetical protein
MKTIGIVACLAAALTLLGTSAQAQTLGWVCYKAKDSDKIIDASTGVVEAINAAFPAEAGCTISSTKLYCAAAATSVSALTVNGTASTGTGFVSPVMDRIGNVPFGTSQVCYKVKCVSPPIPAVDSLAITDPFATRTLTKLKASLVCLPAQENTVTTDVCGDGVVTGSEECDFNGGAPCPNGGSCDSDCQCHCQHACCYGEVPSFPAVSCVEDRGTTSEITAFLANCAAVNPAPGAEFTTAASGACSAGPITTIPCNSGTPAVWLPAGTCD